jgi:hypothetical protein
MTTPIFVGFTTKAVENVDSLMPKFTGRTGTKDAAKIADQIAEKEAAWREEVANMPYTGQLATVQLIIPSKQVVLTYDIGKRQGKTPLCVAVASKLLKLFPNAWSRDTHDRGRSPEVAFFGFNIRLFVKMLGLECSLPCNNYPLPPGLWFTNTDHRDIREAVLPKDYDMVGWDAVVSARRAGLTGTALDEYNALFEGWGGPGKDAERDARITVLLAIQLGFAEGCAVTE